MVWSVSGADGTLLSEGAFGAVSIDVVQIEEVCGGLGSADVLWCWLGGDMVVGAAVSVDAAFSADAVSADAVSADAAFSAAFSADVISAVSVVLHLVVLVN